MSKRFAAVSIVLATVLTLSACANTVRGVGRDVGNTVGATKGAVKNVAAQ